jgi:hypothetical protein
VSDGLNTILGAAIVGAGGTLILDLSAAPLSRLFGIPAANWALVGRWVGHMQQGRFRHENIGEAAPIEGERALGWIVHYAIGVGYGLLLVGLCGAEWLRQPTPLPPIFLALGLLAAPFFVMMPSMGSGVAGARTPRPNLTRLKSLVGHGVFGLGMYATVLLLAAARGYLLTGPAL